MPTNFLVLVPPILVLIIAFFIKNIRIALVSGILAAALILNNFFIIDSLKTVFYRFIKTMELANLTSWAKFWECNYLFILLFLLVLGVIISILEHSGSAFAYGNFIKQKLKSARSAECASLFLSLFFFIDDDFGSLTVGSVMQPVTDMFKIPRIKLGLLVNSIAVPSATLIPLSSWVATIMGQLHQTGVSMNADAKTIILCDPFFTYLKTMPFLFYGLIIVLSVWFIVLRRISYGIIAKHEHIAQTTGTLFGGKAAIIRTKQATHTETNSTLFDFIFPIALLVILSIFEILRGGDFYLFGGDSGLIEVLAYSNIPAALFKGGLATVLITTIYFLVRKAIKFSSLPRYIVEGVNMMKPAVIILILIWTFSGILRADLQIGDFIAKHLIGSISMNFLPLIFFITAVLIAMLIGSAWGTFGLLIPIGLPLVVTLSKLITPVTPDQIQLIYPLLGAIISGSVAGTHLSPISHVMLMSATSTACYHIDLVKAQISFAIPAIISTASAFLLIGLMLQHGYCLKYSLVASFVLGVMLNFAMLSILGWFNKYKQ
ncbi:MAG: Na+ antiporter NhaC [candidate division TM6 bacterium GW2011_GWF2_37_49]|nr:MAG: Na+ antiporter NhaC [candidate division TM6 bacterium GW2011_GWF2_37_49]